jgi:hypothetical protein
MTRAEKNDQTVALAARGARRTGWILLILLAAAGLRLVDLSSAPPGMTHDEADHGLTAWEIVNGGRDIYFTVGYGREPLYDYATALLMAGTGPTIFAARVTSVYFSLLMIAAVYAWARRAFGSPVALLAAAGLAVGFWPVVAGRQALRSIALPAVFALAVLPFWQGLMPAWPERTGEREKESAFAPLLPLPLSPLLFFGVAGLFLGLTLYTYIPARVMWLAFPALAVYLAFAAPKDGRRLRRLVGGTALTLAVAALVAAPLFFHLANNPGLEVRIDELSAPLRAAAGGDFAPLWANAAGALRLFSIEGDQTWRYNIPGKPFLGPIMGALFYVGLLVAGWLSIVGLGNRISLKKPGFINADAGPGAFLALVWLALGFAPVLVTGPGLSMTQAIGALPALYVFTALAVATAFSIIMRLPAGDRPKTTDHGWRSLSGLWPVICGLAAFGLFAALAAQTARDYFGRWANAPEVRVQYEATMVAALRYLDAHGGGAAAVSTITPGRYHTPAVALMTLRNPAIQPRWFDGRQSLLFPAEAGGLMVVPGFTPIPVALQPYLAGAPQIDELPMRPDDIDRPVGVYALNNPGRAVAATTSSPTSNGSPTIAEFGAARLLGYDLSAVEARPGDTLSLVTAWRLEQPLPGASLFAHIVGPDGRPIAQADALGAPGESWVSGDVLLQLHAIPIPPDAPAGEYPLAVGVYTQSDGRRLANDAGLESVVLATVTVVDE